MSRPRRLRSADYKGYRAYSLTIRAYGRTRPFIEVATVEMVMLQILRVAVDEHFEVIAYCFMPDHLHLLVIAHEENADLQRFVRLVKQRSGYAFRRLTGQHLWQDSYFDRTVRKIEELPGLVEYVIRNPLRAGLVGAPADYPFWGSQKYSREELLEFVASARRV